MKSRYQLVFGLAVMAQTLLARGAELAILRNGNSIRHDHRQALGAVTRLYLSDTADGYIEIPSDQIERFELDNAPPSLPSRAESRSASQAAARPLPILLSREQLNQVVAGAGQRHQLDPDFISSVIRAESGFHPFAVSKKGAQGLMQLMPGTASHLGVGDVFDANANVEAGTKYLRELLEKYNYDVVKALAAYNAGPKRVDQYHGMPPYSETQAYVARIIRDFNRQKLAQNPELARKSKAALLNSTGSPKAHRHHQETGAEMATQSVSANSPAGLQ